jgi:hypothetical protein
VSGGGSSRGPIQVRQRVSRKVRPPRERGNGGRGGLRPAGVRGIRRSFQDKSTLGEGPFVRILQSGLPFGKIFGTARAYRFYEGESQKVGGPGMQHADLERLKALIVFRYRVQESE